MPRVTDDCPHLNHMTDADILQFVQDREHPVNKVRSEIVSFANKREQDSMQGAHVGIPASRREELEFAMRLICVVYQFEAIKAAEALSTQDTRGHADDKDNE